ncbi:MAG: hypothetical protein IJK60_05505 [Clostridia bacterium]|nr:hypothetical protein [Clostridia bacterium]
MINININGEKVIITERAKLADFIAVDAYPVEQDGKVALHIPQDLNLPNDIDKMSLYVAGVLIADTKGLIDTVTESVTFNGLQWSDEWGDYLGVAVDGEFANFDNAAGIKIFFGRAD